MRGDAHRARLGPAAHAASGRLLSQCTCGRCHQGRVSLSARLRRDPEEERRRRAPGTGGAAPAGPPAALSAPPGRRLGSRAPRGSPGGLLTTGAFRSAGSRAGQGSPAHKEIQLHSNPSCIPPGRALSLPGKGLEQPPPSWSSHISAHSPPSGCFLLRCVVCFSFFLSWAWVSSIVPCFAFLFFN